MSHTDALSQWTETVSTSFPILSRRQCVLLALISFGMVIAESCGQRKLAVTLALLIGAKEAAMRQRIREWCYAAEDKRGTQRIAIEEAVCFPYLLRWVLRWWPADERRLALAMDATTLGQRFTVLVISVVYRGCAIPVAWVVLPACKKGAWKPHWERLFTSLKDVVPTDWLVIVLADRGLYAKWLFRSIQQRGWHPFLRINLQGQVRREGEAHWNGLRSIAPALGTAWSGAVTCFSSPDAQLACTLLARWDVGYTDPWLVLTDLAPAAADVAWYGLRTWIEGGFKDQKRGGWHWEQTKMTDPARASRWWLVIAVATLWVVSVGGAADATLPASSLDALPDTHVARRCRPRGTQPRFLSCFARGMLVIRIALIKGEAIPSGRFIPEPWPDRRLTIPPATGSGAVLVSTKKTPVYAGL